LLNSVLSRESFTLRWSVLILIAIASSPAGL
jgi:hypothetical protein